MDSTLTTSACNQLMEQGLVVLPQVLDSMDCERALAAVDAFKREHPTAMAPNADDFGHLNRVVNTHSVPERASWRYHRHRERKIAHFNQIDFGHRCVMSLRRLRWPFSPYRCEPGRLTCTKLAAPPAMRDNRAIP